MHRAGIGLGWRGHGPACSGRFGRASERRKRPSSLGQIIVSFARRHA
jgi:hypothetical protein